MAGGIRSESYPRKILCYNMILEEGPSVAGKAACEAACTSTPWTHRPGLSTPGPGLSVAQALRPGAARYTCNGELLGPGFQPQVPQHVESRFVSCEDGASTAATQTGQRNSLGAEPDFHFSVITPRRQDMPSPSCAVASPFSAPDFQLLHVNDDVTPQGGLDFRAVESPSTWPAVPYGDGASNTSTPRAPPLPADSTLDYPATPARGAPEAAATEAAAPFSAWFDTLLQLERQDTLMLAQVMSEAPYPLPRSSSGESLDTEGLTAAAAAAEALPYHDDAPKPEPEAEPEPEASACPAASGGDTFEAWAAVSAGAEAEASSCASVPALSSQASLDRYSDVRPTSREAAEHEANSPACDPADAADAAEAAETVDTDRHAYLTFRGRRSRFAPQLAPVAEAAPEQLRAPPSPAPEAPARPAAKRRAAAAAAEAVVRRSAAAARSDEDDEDYDEAEDLGAAGRAAKRAKKGGAGRQTPRRLVCGATCLECGATRTPQWRSGPDGPRTLCNACGVRFKKGFPLTYLARKSRQAGAGL